MIYYTFIDENLKDEILNKYIKSMPKIRQLECNNFFNKKDKINNVTAFLLLKKIINDIEKNVNFENFCYAKNGKPYIRFSKFTFNFSHSGNLVVCAFNEENIGVDVEIIESVDAIFVDHVYSLEEKNKYAKKLTEPNFFTKVWVSKEAYAKFTGLGIKTEFNKINMLYKNNTFNYRGLTLYRKKIQNYFLCVCCNKKIEKIKKIDFNCIFNS